MLPGGYAVDWLAAGTYDRSVGFSLFTLQITHKIAENTDVERDFVVSTVTKASPEVELEVIRNFSTGYHTRNGGGDRIETDGDLPILDLRPVAVGSPDPQPGTDSRDRLPAPTAFGAGVTFVRALLYLFVAVVVSLSTESYAVAVDKAGLKLSEEQAATLDLIGVGVLLAAAVVDVALAVFVLLGHNWARIWLMSVCVFTSVFAFVGNVRGDQAITLSNLPTIGSSILVLLALSSHRARDFATRRRRRAPA
jgi:hypothetical protein